MFSSAENRVRLFVSSCKPLCHYQFKSHFADSWDLKMWLDVFFMDCNLSKCLQLLSTVDFVSFQNVLIYSKKLVEWLQRTKSVHHIMAFKNLNRILKKV